MLRTSSDIPLLHPISQRLEDFRSQRRLQAGSLLISLFGDAVLPRGGRLWLGSLIRLLQPLGLSERLVRTAVFRLAKERWLRPEALGRRADYELTDTGRRRFYAASQHIYAAQAPNWDRRWRLLILIGKLESKTLERVRRALFWQGFGSLGADTCIHPSADLDSALDALIAEGLESALAHIMPFIAAQAPSIASANDLVARAWDLADLARAYDSFCHMYQPILTELQAAAAHPDKTTGEATDEEAFLLRLLLIHDYRRLLLRDPELPDVLLASNWPGQQARTISRDIYRRLLEPSERHLNQHCQLADGSRPNADATLEQRFAGSDPLAQ